MDKSEREMRKIELKEVKERKEGSLRKKKRIRVKMVEVKVRKNGR